MAHFIKADFKSGNGRRISKEFGFPLSKLDPASPEGRAEAVSYATHIGFGKNWNIINWTFVEK